MTQPTVFIIYSRERYSPFALRVCSTRDIAKQWIKERNRKELKGWNYKIDYHIEEVEIDGKGITYDADKTPARREQHRPPETPPHQGSAGRSAP